MYVFVFFFYKLIYFFKYLLYFVVEGTVLRTWWTIWWCLCMLEQSLGAGVWSTLLEVVALVAAGWVGLMSDVLPCWCVSWPLAQQMTLGFWLPLPSNDVDCSTRYFQLWRFGVSAQKWLDIGGSTKGDAAMLGVLMDANYWAEGPYKRPGGCRQYTGDNHVALIDLSEVC